MIKIEDKLKSVESESGVLASLIQNPELVFYSEFLKPKDFSNLENQAVYAAIQNIAPMGIQNVDAYIIMESLKSNDGSRRYEKYVDLERLKEFVEMSPAIARRDVEEYMLLVHNVMDAALRRETLAKLQECEKYCTDLGVTDLEQRIYGAIDDVMMEFSTANEIPQFRDVVDECWREICDRQNDGYAGIPFKFPTLNEYATIEKGELFIFAAEAKQGKSMMLLNCAVDLLKKDKKVLYLDSELNTRLFTARMLSHLTGIEYKRLTSGTYDAGESERIEDAINWLKTRDFTHIYMPMFDIQTIYASIQKVRHTQGVDVLIVDQIWFTLNALNCWNTLRAAIPQRGSEQLRARRSEKFADWAISSQAANSGRFNDYPAREYDASASEVVRAGIRRRYSLLCSESCS